jgi:hypothetical protein
VRTAKRPLDPDRIRKLPPEGFSWIDRRLVRDGWIDRLPKDALLLYFFLVAVSDKDGLSFYADRTVSRILDLGKEELSEARICLLRAGLILHDHPLYQVLPLSPRGPTIPRSSRAHPENREPREPMSLGEILRRAWREVRPARRRPETNRRTIK